MVGVLPKPRSRAREKFTVKLLNVPLQHAFTVSNGVLCEQFYLSVVLILALSRLD